MDLEPVTDIRLRAGKPTVALIILNYNTSEAVIALHRQITALRQPAFDDLFYLVVDNASRPDDATRLREFFSGRPDSELILNKTNDGYAAGNNLGLKRAAELRHEYCMVANSDISFLTPDFIEQLVHAAQSLPHCGMIGPKVILPDGRPQGPLPETGILNAVIPLPVPVANETRPVYATVGCCLFGPTSVFQRIGFFDESTFLYREEIILAENLQRQGLAWYYLPAVVVRHDHVRKTGSVRRIRLHKKFEAESTVYYFRRYKQRSAVAIAIYRALIAAKTGALIASHWGRGALQRLRTPVPA